LLLHAAERPQQDDLVAACERLLQQQHECFSARLPTKDRDLVRNSIFNFA
jgi:hypothetical protein